MKAAFAGWRGMVGSVLLERMEAENDFDEVDVTFLSTSQAGKSGPRGSILADAYDLSLLSGFDVVISCQGSDYTKKVHSGLRKSGWRGYWIDSASELRQKSFSVLVLDPVNRSEIDKAIEAGVKDLIGANCTVSPMLMGLSGLFKSGLVEWANLDTYQAVSGAGAKFIMELLDQMRFVGSISYAIDDNIAARLAKIDRRLKSSELPTDNFGFPIAGNLLPWIDADLGNGQSREEAKTETETNKILNTNTTIPIDGTCVRVGSFRSHATAVTIKLKKNVPLGKIEEMIKSANEWVDFVPNEREATLSRLSPVAVSGTLNVAVGRVRKLSMGPEYLGSFVVGDQLLWGAAEPLRRVLHIVNKTL